MVKLRNVQADDCILLLRWANDSAVRQSAFDSRTIEWEEHHNWFSKKENDPDCFQYIALKNQDVPIGQIRFDVADSIVDIDYSIDKNFRGIGLGKLILKKGIERLSAELEKSVTLQGRVKKENKASIRVFQKAGFQKIDHKSINKKNSGVEIYIIFQRSLKKNRGEKISDPKGKI